MEIQTINDLKSGHTSIAPIEKFLEHTLSSFMLLEDKNFHPVCLHIIEFDITLHYLSDGEIGKCSSPLVEVHYSWQDLNVSSHIALQTLIIHWLNWLIEAQWVRSISMDVTLCNWYPKYKIGNNICICQMYLPSLQTQISDSVSRQPRQPVALTSLLRFRLVVDQSDILFCT
jgi:hypothetical protein